MSEVEPTDEVERGWCTVELHAFLRGMTRAEVDTVMADLQRVLSQHGSALAESLSVHSAVGGPYPDKDSAEADMRRAWPFDPDPEYPAHLLRSLGLRPGEDEAIASADLSEQAREVPGLRELMDSPKPEDL